MGVMRGLQDLARLFNISCKTFVKLGTTNKGQ